MSAFISVRDLTVRYGRHTALDRVSLDASPHEILGIIGPANSGKTTLLRCINRTIETIPSARVSGQVAIDGRDVFGMKNVHELRRQVGMVQPLPVGLPLTVYDNVAFAPRLVGIHRRADLDPLVEQCLRRAALWDELKDRLQVLATTLSGGQQQRLTIARALSHRPTVLCLDEFSIAIDPVTTMKIETVLQQLKHEMTIVMVTNLVEQAHRLADRVAFLNHGTVIEAGPTRSLFSDRPASRETFEYVRGHFG